MKLRDGGLIIILIVAVAAAIGITSVAVLGPGNPVEKEEAQVVSEETNVPAEVIEQVEEEAVQEGEKVLKKPAPLSSK